jgi:hypothetical protein
MARTESGVEFIRQCCKPLLSYGVSQITFEYDGSGDSGDMDYVSVTIVPTQEQVDDCFKSGSRPGNEITSATQPKTIRFDDFIAERKKEKKPLVTPKMCDQLLDEAFSLLPGGWEINDGSYGTVIIDTAKETIEVEHNERYTEVRTETFNY